MFGFDKWRAQRSGWRVSEFALVMQPLKLWGATGSTVSPAALR